MQEYKIAYCKIAYSFPQSGIICNFQRQGFPTVTSPKDIQSLIADLDNLLLNSDTEQQEVLEGVRDYLEALPQEGRELTSPEQRTAKEIAKAVLGEMESFRADVTGSVETELMVLRQQREAMEKDIKRLEVQQQQMMAEFLQKLASSCIETLTREITGTLEKLEIQFLGDNSLDTPAAFQQKLRLEQLQQFQRRSDRLLVNLDTTIQTVFQTLERDLHSYQESLSQGVENIHSLGQQGETMFTFLINRLLQQLGEPNSVDETQKEIPEVKGLLVKEQEEEEKELLSSQEISPRETSTQKTTPVDQTVNPLPNRTQLFPFAGTEITSPTDVWVERDHEDEKEEPEKPEELEKPSEVDNLLYLDLTKEEVDVPRDYGDSEVLSESAEEVDSIDSEEEESAYIEAMEDVLFDASENSETSQFSEIDSTSQSDSPEEVLFGEKVEEENNNVEEVETIAALTDVLERTSSDVNQTTDLEEGDATTQLSSDENLLPTEDKTGETDLRGIIDQSTLEKLNEDLELFEGDYQEEDEGPDTEIQLADGRIISLKEESEPDTEIQLVVPQGEESEPDTEIQLINPPTDTKSKSENNEVYSTSTQEIISSSSSNSDAEVLTPPEELLGENLENLLIESFANEQELSSQLQMDKITGFSQEFFWDESEEEEEEGSSESREDMNNDQ